MRQLSFEQALDTAFKDAMSDFDAIAWRPFLRALDGHPPSEDQADTFARYTGRTAPFTSPPRAAQACCGRRSGKTRVASLVAAVAASFWDHSAYLAKRGERARILLLSASRDQSTVAKNYVLALLESDRVTAKLIDAVTADTISLTNRVDIVIQAASFRSTRGFTVPLVIADEVSLWRDSETSLNPAREIFRALSPSMANVPEPLLLSISTPFAKEGWFYEQHAKHWGDDDSHVLAWKAASLDMNPTLDPAVVDAAYADDPQSAAAEYGGEFRSDIASYIDRDVLIECTESGREQRGYIAGTKYIAFADPASGSGRDSFTLAIAHAEDGVAVLDVLEEHRPPFDPHVIIAGIAATLRAYGLMSCTGDKYAANFVTSAFLSAGIKYTHSTRDRSAIYLAALPLLNAKRVALLDHKRLVNQFAALQRRASSSGKQSVDHAKNGADDVSNAAAGALALAIDGPSTPDYCSGGHGGVVAEVGYLPNSNPNDFGPVDIRGHFPGGGGW